MAPVLGKDNSRIYYVRELNPQLLLIASVYAMDFTNVFVTPVDFSDICVRLISQDHTVIYSTTSDDIGQPLPEEIEKRLGEHPNSAFFSSGLPDFRSRIRPRFYRCLFRRHKRNPF